MKKILCSGFAAIVMAISGFAQDEGNIWTFGFCNSMTFTSGVPVYGGVPGTGNTTMTTGFYRSNAIADASGNLLFYVKIDNADLSGTPPAASTRFNIYDRFGNAMANSVLVTAAPVTGPIQIIKKPGNSSLYYVIYSLNGALLSTTVDMDLNGGTGGVVAGEKGIIISGWQSIVGEKTTVVQGCDCIWLVVRAKTANQYKSYRITEAGIDITPVISDCGLLPLVNYFDVYIGPPGGSTIVTGQGIGKAGLLKASVDGKQLVACCQKGLELYDFSKCSGKVSNARLLDTTSFYQACYYGAAMGQVCHDSIPVSYYSAEFSPDGSRLYATYFYSRHVFQFDLSLVSASAMMASKTTVLSNRYSIAADLPNGCTIIDTTAMGDLKRGPDGKIYIGNNAYYNCGYTSVSAQNYALHVINNPNNAGMACNAQQEGFILGPLDADHSQYRTSVNFNPQIVMPPSPRDTVTSATALTLCMGDILQADTTGDCYHWNTGVDSAAFTIDASGTYIVSWSGQDCTYHIDSFIVSVAPFPDVPLLLYGCPGDINILIKNTTGDTSTYTYSLSNADSSIIFSHTGNGGYQLSGLPAGTYTLQITGATGCDTVLNIQLEEYPKPELTTSPEDTTIRYGSTIRLKADGASIYSWLPPGSLDSATIADPLATPLKNTDYTVTGINEYGCMDTGYVHINMDYSIPDMIPNAFSPNGDGLNDAFRVEGITYQKVEAFDIYNRFGQWVFSTVDAGKGWDGTQNGRPCDAGTYYYFIKLNYPNGLTRTYKGDVTLIR